MKKEKKLAKNSKGSFQPLPYQVSRMPNDSKSNEVQEKVRKNKLRDEEGLKRESKMYTQP